jgi:hypothetical protein
MKHVPLPRTDKIKIAVCVVLCLLAALYAIETYRTGLSDPCRTDTMRLMGCE